MKVEIVGYESQASWWDWTSTALRSGVRDKRRDIAAIVDNPAHPFHPATVTNVKHAPKKHFKNWFTFHMHFKS